MAWRPQVCGKLLIPGGPGAEGAGESEARLDIGLLQELSGRPPLFAPGKMPFWDDAHISEQMLKAHLDPTRDAASRRPETIERSVNWLVGHLGLVPGTEVLDLGCGPGLYAQRLVERGLKVTGVDYSRRSIRYAQMRAAEAGLDVTYVLQDYLEMDYEEQFDVALLIYCDFGALPGEDGPDRLLGRVRRALRPGGRFVFDVLTASGRRAARPAAGWAASSGGFWRPGPHLVLTRTLEYPEAQAELDEYLVVEAGGSFAVYRLWERYFGAGDVRELLARNGLVVEELWADLAGAELGCEEGPGLGIVAKKG